jgi:hypothetical protein
MFVGKIIKLLCNDHKKDMFDTNGTHPFVVCEYF